MATQEVVLRPGDSISVRIDVPGQPLRLEMSLSPNGVAVSGDIPMGAPTIYGGVPTQADEPEPVDLTDEFALEDTGMAEAPAQQNVESLAAVEPFGDAPEAVDIPFEDISDESGTEMGGGFEETVTDDSTGADDLDLDLGDLGDDMSEIVEDSSVEIADGDNDLSLDMEDGGLEDGGIDIPSDDVDVPEDDGFSADAMTMLPPTRQDSAPALAVESEEDVLGDLSLDDEPAPQPQPDDSKKKFEPNQDDTLPVWTGKARAYKDPEVEKKKTSKLDKSGSKPAPAAKPVPGKAKLPAAAKKPVTKPIRKPTGQVGPAAAAKQPGGAGNFTVFLSPPKGADKKQAAAEIIAEIQGIDMSSAMALAGKMIVPVVKGVSEDEAQGVRDRFKDAGLSCRITQKR